MVVGRLTLYWTNRQSSLAGTCQVTWYSLTTLHLVPQSLSPSTWNLTAPRILVRWKQSCEILWTGKPESNSAEERLLSFSPLFFWWCYLFIYLLAYLFIYSFIRSFIRSFIHCKNKGQNRWVIHRVHKQ